MGTNVAIISIKSTPFQFIIEPFAHDFDAYKVSFVKYGPAYPVANAGGPGSKIDGVISWLKSWLAADVKSYFDDVSAIDLWEEYNNGGAYLEVEDIQINDISFFSKDDQLQLALAIGDLKSLIPQKFIVSEEQMLSINAKLDYLLAASERVSKTDWKGVAIGIIASIIIALSLDTEKGRQMWELVAQIFRTIRLIQQ